MYRSLGQTDIATLPIASPSYSGGAVLPSLPQIYEAAPQNPGFFDIPYSQISLVTPPSPQPAVSQPSFPAPAAVPGYAPAAAAVMPAAAPVATQFSTWLNTGSNKLYLVAGLGLIVVALAAKRRR